MPATLNKLNAATLGLPTICLRGPTKQSVLPLTLKEYPPSLLSADACESPTARTPSARMP